MGSKLGTLWRSRSSSLSDPIHTEFEGKVPLHRSPSFFADVLMPRCLKAEISKEEELDQHRMPTLEEWLTGSPGFELQHRRQSPKVCPLNSLPDYQHHNSTPRTSCATDDGLLVSRDDGVTSFSRSESRKQRRVSFRLPEEADIHVIHTRSASQESHGYESNTSTI